MTNKPIASLSVDLDNQWSYLKTHGDPSWQALPSYLDLVVPRILSFLGERRLRITFFLVGQDAALPGNLEALGAIAAATHEIGNHSYHHEPWLHRYSDAEIADELDRSDEAIQAATGQRPVGFRGPGYSLSPATLRTLAQRGYRYDATTLPTFIGPLARAYYFRRSRLGTAEREQRAALFGSWRDGLLPLRPYRWHLGGNGTHLVEVPVTTMPFVRIPIHFSYLLSISAISPRLARAYFQTALWLCHRSGVAPSLLLHPLDFLDGNDVADLRFFPGMDVGYAAKLERLGEYVDALARWFALRSVLEHVEALTAAAALPARLPSATGT